MPNITEFDAGNLQVRPSEIGVESVAAAGRRLGVYGSQIAGAYERTGAEIGRGVATVGNVAEQYMAHQEISSLAAHAATFVANKNQQLNDFLTGKDIDPNDPQRQDKVNARVNNPQALNEFREQNLEPGFEQLSQGLYTQQGKQWFERWQDSYRNHVLEHGAAVQSSMAGAVVQANTEKTINALTVASFNDPSSLETNKALLKHSLEGIAGSSPTLLPEHAAKIQEELGLRGEEALVKSAIQGAIIKGGNWQAIANDPKNADYVKPAENMQFVRQEQMYQRMEAAEARNARVMTDYVNRQNFNDAADKLELSTLPQKVGDPVVLPPNYWEDVKKIGTQPGVDPARLRSLIDNGERVTERMNMPKVANDQALSDSLFARALSDPTFSERDIAKNITHLDDNNVRRLVETVKMLRDDELNNPFFKSAMAGAKELIEGKTDLERSMSAGKFAEFEYGFLRDYLAAARAGKLEGDALNIENPNSMISKAMAPYKNTVQEMLRKSLGTNGMAAPPPMPTQPAAPTAPTAPTVGTIRNYQGKVYQFQGGDWNDPKAWKEIS